MTPQHPILLVEDSPEDYQITVRTFRKSNVSNPIYRCEDGDQALDFLHQRGSFAGAALAPRPGIILLDLNLPGTDGREVLAEIKQDAGLKEIPVVVLTSSTDERDIDQCYQAGANSYLQKPVELTCFATMVQCLKEFWFEAAEVPDMR